MFPAASRSRSIPRQMAGIAMITVCPSRVARKAPRWCSTASTTAAIRRRPLIPHASPTQSFGFQRGSGSSQQIRQSSRAGTTAISRCCSAGFNASSGDWRRGAHCGSGGRPAHAADRGRRRARSPTADCRETARREPAVFQYGQGGTDVLWNDAFPLGKPPGRESAVPVRAASTESSGKTSPRLPPAPDVDDARRESIVLSAWSPPAIWWRHATGRLTVASARSARSASVCNPTSDCDAATLAPSASSVSTRR